MNEQSVEEQHEQDKIAAVLLWLAVGQILVLPACFFGLAQIAFGVAIAAFVVAVCTHITSLIWVTSIINKTLSEDDYYIQYLILTIALIGFLVLLGSGWLYLNMFIQSSFGEGT